MATYSPNDASNQAIVDDPYHSGSMGSTSVDATFAPPDEGTQSFHPHPRQPAPPGTVIVASHVVVSKQLVAAVHVSCGKGKPCAGVLVLSKRVAHRFQAVVFRKGKRRKMTFVRYVRLILGRTNYDLKPLSSQVLKIHLSSAYLKLAGARGRKTLRVDFAATELTSSTSFGAITLGLPVGPKRKSRHRAQR
jgi:hypothetical protein